MFNFPERGREGKYVISISRLRASVEGRAWQEDARSRHHNCATNSGSTFLGVVSISGTFVDNGFCFIPKCSHHTALSMKIQTDVL